MLEHAWKKNASSCKLSTSWKKTLAYVIARTQISQGHDSTPGLYKEVSLLSRVTATYPILRCSRAEPWMSAHLIWGVKLSPDHESQTPPSVDKQEFTKLL